MNVLHLKHSEVCIGKNLSLKELAEKSLAQASKIVIITDTTVKSIHGEQLLQDLQLSYSDTQLIEIPPGETSKSREMKARLEDRLFELGCDRSTLLIALGGGVVTDLVGFVAATFCRGVPFISIPTTLLAMVDASIGGKTGINIPYGKNLIGAFYFPVIAMCDVCFLQSLPKKEIKEGLVEAIKTALVASDLLFQFIAAETSLLFSDISVQESLVQSCATIKIKTVLEDETESTGKRRILNFGHTAGHAIERVSSYQISHGTAVAMGIVIASYLSYKEKLLPKDQLDRIIKLLQTFELIDQRAMSFSLDAILKAMETDKKSQEGRPRFVLLKQIGEAESFGGSYCKALPDTLIREALTFAASL